jgi:hypothetical protein
MEHYLDNTFGSFKLVYTPIMVERNLNNKIRKEIKFLMDIMVDWNIFV